jgi:hypothetical protein
MTGVGGITKEKQITARREKLADNLVGRFVRTGCVGANLIGERHGFNAKGF